ncbi:MAG: hypothetical protein C5B58_04300 [Acidobacteria bacterium]|nr:MAG: hypothetical protein C5B58_04300 [Acidobacteriota bacterium]
MVIQASALERATARGKEVSWPWGFWGVVSIGLIYGVIYSTMRTAISPNLPPGPPLRKADLTEPSAVVWRQSEGTNLPKDAAPFLDQIATVSSAAPEELHIPWKLGDRSETWKVLMVQPSVTSGKRRGGDS